MRFASTLVLLPNLMMSSLNDELTGGQQLAWQYEMEEGVQMVPRDRQEEGWGDEGSQQGSLPGLFRAPQWLPELQRERHDHRQQAQPQHHVYLQDPPSCEGMQMPS